MCSHALPSQADIFFRKNHLDKWLLPNSERLVVDLGNFVKFMH